jgi:hypothetical protein
MSYYYGNPNFSLDPELKGPQFALAGTKDYSFLKNNPMFKAAFQTEADGSDGTPPAETSVTNQKGNDPSGLSDNELLRELIDGARADARYYNSPEFMAAQGRAALDFERERLRLGKPYALMEKIPDTISKGFDRQAQQIGLQAAMIGASSNDIANIVGGTRIPQINIPGGTPIQQQRYI